MKCVLVFRKPVVENLVTWLACSPPLLFFWRGRGTKRVLETREQRWKTQRPLFSRYIWKRIVASGAPGTPGVGTPGSFPTRLPSQVEIEWIQFLCVNVFYAVFQIRIFVSLAPLYCSCRSTAGTKDSRGCKECLSLVNTGMQISLAAASPC